MVKIGSPFSPEMISLVQRKQENDRAFAQSEADRKERSQARQQARSDARENRAYNRFQGRQDSFLNTQFRADEAEKDRDLRREMSREGRADKDIDYQRGEDRFQQGREDVLERDRIEDVESKRRFGLGQALKKKELGIKEAESGRKSEADAVKALSKLGFAPTYDAKGDLVYNKDGSLKRQGKDLAGSGRAKNIAGISLSEAKTELTKKNTEQVQLHIENYWPEKIKDAAFKRELQTETLRLKEMALEVNSMMDARRLAIQAAGMWKDPMFGGFEKSADAARKVAQEIMENLPEATRETFGKAWRDEIQEQQAAHLESKRQERIQESKDREEAAKKRTDMSDPAVRKLYGVSPKPNAAGR